MNLVWQIFPHVPLLSGFLLALHSLVLTASAISAIPLVISFAFALIFPPASWCKIFRIPPRFQHQLSLLYPGVLMPDEFVSRYLLTNSFLEMA
ncbi:hypothetical protein HDK64DRAFT_107118 [Phyllosticta capitalensis]